MIAEYDCIEVAEFAILAQLRVKFTELTHLASLHCVALRRQLLRERKRVIYPYVGILTYRPYTKHAKDQLRSSKRFLLCIIKSVLIFFLIKWSSQPMQDFTIHGIAHILSISIEFLNVLSRKRTMKCIPPASACGGILLYFFFYANFQTTFLKKINFYI